MAPGRRPSPPISLWRRYIRPVAWGALAIASGISPEPEQRRRVDFHVGLLGVAATACLSFRFALRRPAPERVSRRSTRVAPMAIVVCAPP